MPDSRIPEDTMNDDVNVRIRRLVARAVADAPAAPDITRRDVLIEPAEPGRRRWWIAGGAAVAAAAAMIIGLVVVTTGEEATEPTPATQPPPPVTTLAPEPATTPPGTTAPTTRPGPPVAPATPPRILAAGPDGVIEYVAEEEPHAITNEDMAIALDTGDGRVITQRVAGWTGSDGNWERTVPQVLSEDGSLSDLFGTADWDGAVTLHDIEQVDGRDLLLFGLQTGQTLADTRQVLYVADLQTGVRTEVARDVGAVVLSSDRLQMATNGLIVGTWSNSVATGITFYAVPGSAADGQTPEPADLGLGEPFVECLDCPRSFAMSPDGGTFAWLEGERTLHLRDLDGTYDGLFELHDTTPNTIGAALEIGGSQLVLTPHRLNSDSPPVEIDLADPTSEPFALAGRWATFGPAATLPDLTLPPSTTAPPPSEPPTTTTAPPASGVIDDVVTAGPGGVVAYQDGDARSVTTEPMELALATGDGRYVVQRRVGNAVGTDQADTAPLLLDPDGSLTPLWPDAEPAFFTVHDIELVGDRPVVVYTTVADVVVNVESDVTAHIMVGPLVQPTSEHVELDTWDTYEGNVGRLHMATTGLIVGQLEALVDHRLAVYAVPGSPAAANPLPTAASLGLEDQYSDCNECPYAFTVSPHGRVFAWLHRTPGIDGHMELVVHPADGGPEQRFDPFPADVNTTLIDDLDYLAEGAQLLSYFNFDGNPQLAPMHIAADGTTTELSGVVATGDPTGS